MNNLGRKEALTISLHQKLINISHMIGFAQLNTRSIPCTYLESRKFIHSCVAYIGRIPSNWRYDHSRYPLNWRLILVMSTWTCFNPVQGPGVTRGRGLQRKWHSWCGYVDKISEQVKIIVIKGESSCELVPQNWDSWEEAAIVEITSYQWNTKVMGVGRYRAWQCSPRRLGIAELRNVRRLHTYSMEIAVEQR